MNLDVKMTVSMGAELILSTDIICVLLFTCFIKGKLLIPNDTIYISTTRSH